jgi:hypothetical protein
MASDSMESQGLDLAALIRPTDIERFFAEHWGKQPLLIERCASAYLSNKDLEESLSHADARYPAIRLAKGGAFYPLEAYTQDIKYGDEVFRGVRDVENLHRVHSRGHRRCAGPGDPSPARPRVLAPSLSSEAGSRRAG